MIPGDAAETATELDRINWPELRRLRLERVRSAMETFGLDAIAAFEYANGRYIGDLRPLWAPNFLLRQAVLVTRSSPDVICLVHQDDAAHRRALMNWFRPDQIREFPTAAFVESASSEAVEPVRVALGELGFVRGRIGIDVTTVKAMENLRAALPGAEFVDAGPAMNVARLVKSPAEVELMRVGSRVVDLAMAAAVDAIGPGVRECEVLAEAMRVFYRHGAEVPQCNLVVCSGPNTVPMQRYAGYRQIQPGDLVFMDIGACFGGMFTEATRTVVLGLPNETQRAIYRLVYEIHRRVIEVIRPGATADDLRGAAADSLDRSEYGSAMQKMVLIHGIGVGYAEAPFVRPPRTPTAPLVLEPGMTLAVVPTILVPGVSGGGGIRLEDVVAVTEDGVEQLTAYPYAEALLR
jgi:Xaa-Pro aminopeptidase